LAHLVLQQRWIKRLGANGSEPIQKVKQIMNIAASTTAEPVLIVVLVLVVVGIAAFLLLQRRRTAKLRTQFGDAEYTRAIEKSGNRKNAEAGLEGRAHRVDGLPVRLLSPGDRARFEDSWRGVQARFIDGPAGAVSEADRLLGDVMATRGYPTGDFEQRAADISVDHPLVLENYRAAHEIAVHQMQGKATTEDLRQAMVHYRTLFDELVSEPAIPAAKATSSSR
jgi:hypothetical protein